MAWVSCHYRRICRAYVISPTLPHDQPTRITSNTTSLIFTNDVTCLSVNGLIVNDLSHHLPIFSFSLGNLDYDTSTKRESIVVRDFKDEHVNNSRSSLERVDWENLDESDASSASESFANKFSELTKTFLPKPFNLSIVFKNHVVTL